MPNHYLTRTAGLFSSVIAALLVNQCGAFFIVIDPNSNKVDWTATVVGVIICLSCCMLACLLRGYRSWTTQTITIQEMEAKANDPQEWTASMSEDYLDELDDYSVSSDSRLDPARPSDSRLNQRPSDSRV